MNLPQKIATVPFPKAKRVCNEGMEANKSKLVCYHGIIATCSDPRQGVVRYSLVGQLDPCRWFCLPRKARCDTATGKRTAIILPVFPADSAVQTWFAVLTLAKNKSSCPNIATWRHIIQRWFQQVKMNGDLHECRGVRAISKVLLANGQAGRAPQKEVVVADTRAWPRKRKLGIFTRERKGVQGLSGFQEDGVFLLDHASAFLVSGEGE